MTKFLTGLLAAILVLGLLAACQQAPGAAPGTPPTTPTDPTDPVDPPVDPTPPATFDLSLNGWGDPTATDGIDWEITVTGSQRDTGGTPNDQSMIIQISKDHRGYTAALRNSEDNGDLCTILNRPITTSGLTISFSHTTSTDAPCGAANSDASAFSAFDNRSDTSSGNSSGVVNGDKIEISLTLAEAPNTAPVDKATAQKIKVSGMVTVTHDDDADSTTDQDATATYMISGEITYNRPVTPKP